MAKERILVDDELFLGRLDEQDRFREALRGLLRPAQPDDPPFIFLLYGEGGMGKSKLLRRFRDIAELEAPFEGEFSIRLVDWELERHRRTSLQVSRDAITTEVVFDLLHQAALDAGWSRHLKPYQDAVNRRGEAEKKVAEALSKETGESRYAGVRDLGAEVIAAIVRRGTGVSGKWQAPLAKGAAEVIQGGAEQLAQVNEWLKARARLKPEEEAIYREPNENLARALGAGFAAVANSKPLIVLLDTYEIVARTDPWLRVAVEAAGPRVMWIIAGRDNLRDSRPADRFVGYSAEFPRRLAALDVQELAIQYVVEYLGERAPDRPVSREEAAALHAATSGIPLAIRQAGDLWARGVSLEAITGDIPDRSSRDEIVRLMSDRVLVHCLTDTVEGRADRRALFLLAMQRRPDPKVQAAALRPADGPFDLTARLNELTRRYSAVRLPGGARLHEGMAAFLRERLLTSEMKDSDERRELAQRASDAAQSAKTRLEEDLPLLEERCESDDWQESALDAVHWLFWKDEREAWRELLPLMVDGLGYNWSLARGLLEVVEAFEPGLSKDGRKRLKALRAGIAEEDDKGTEALLAELERALQRADDEDIRTIERRAILELQRGQLLYQRKRYAEALAQFEKAEKGLPDENSSLRRQLAEALDDLAGALMWPEGPSKAVLSVEAEHILPKVVAWLPEKKSAWYRLATTYSLAGRSEEAIAAYQRAIDLDPKYAYPHNGLGNVYADLGRTEEALAAYERAIDLDPKYAAPHYGLGNVYRDLGRTEEALAAYQRAIDLDPKVAYPHNGLGNVYADLGRTEEALAAYQRAIDLDPKFAYPHNNLGNVYRALGRTEEALAA
ncbi:MAG TPA: tetratricopeptide repeat protein [Anaerolineae bacterium]|nr:tetratricopeptide repeat protein [Anaerolineae bacterium]